jgi:hypothetical protein
MQRRWWAHGVVGLLAGVTLCVGCTEDEGATAPPGFNYIPLHDDVCEPQTQGELDSAWAAVHALVQPADGKTDWVVRDLSLCVPESCGACESNPFKDLLDALDEEAWFIEGLDPSFFTMSSAEYVDQALQFPIRDLVVHVQSLDGTALLSLSETQEMACTYPDGDEVLQGTYFAVQGESLASDCQTPQQSMQGTWTSSGDQVTVEAMATNNFGFLVPMVTYLPEPESFTTVHHLQDWVRVQPHLAVDGMDPEISVQLDGEAGCFQMSISVPIANLFSFWEETPAKMALLAELVQERSIPVTGDTIELRLTGELDPAGLANGVPTALGDGESPVRVDSACSEFSPDAKAAEPPPAPSKSDSLDLVGVGAVLAWYEPKMDGALGGSVSFADLSGSASDPAAFWSGMPTAFVQGSSASIEEVAFPSDTSVLVDLDVSPVSWTAELDPETVQGTVEIGFSDPTIPSVIELVYGDSSSVELAIPDGAVPETVEVHSVLLMGTQEGYPIPAYPGLEFSSLTETSMADTAQEADFEESGDVDIGELTGSMLSLGCVFSLE